MSVDMQTEGMLDRLDFMSKPEHKPIEDPRRIVADVEDLAANEFHNGVRDRFQTFLDQEDYIHLYKFVRNYQLSTGEKNLLQQKLRQELESNPDSLSFEVHFKLLQQVYADGTNYDDIKDFLLYRYLEDKNYTDRRAMDTSDHNPIWKQLEAGLLDPIAFENLKEDYKNSNMAMKEEFITSINKRFDSIFNYLSYQPKLLPLNVNTSYVRELTHQKGEDATAIKEQITQDFKQRLIDGDKSQTLLNAMARINSGVLIGMYQAGECSWLTKEHVINALALESPEDLFYHLQDGFITINDIDTKVDNILEKHPLVLIRNIQLFSSKGEDRIQQILTRCFQNADIDIIFQTIEQTHQQEFFNSHAEFFNHELKKQVLEEVQLVDGFKKKLSILHRYASLGMVREETLEDIKLDVFDIVSDKVYEDIVKEIQYFCDSEQISVKSALENQLYVLSSKIKHMNQLSVYEAFGLSDADFRYMLLKPFLERFPFQEKYEMAGDILILNRKKISDQKKTNLMNAILREPLTKDSVDLLEMIRPEKIKSESLSGLVSTRINELLDTWDEQMNNGINGEQKFNITSAMYDLFLLNNSFDDPQLVKKMILFIQKHELDAENFFNYLSIDNIAGVVKKLEPDFAINLIRTIDDESAYMIFLHHTIGNPEQKAQIFKELQSKNEIMRQFKSYEEYTMYVQTIKRPYLSENLRPLLDLRTQIGDAQWSWLTKNSDILDLLDHIDKLPTFVKALHVHEPFLKHFLFGSGSYFIFDNKISETDFQLLDSLSSTLFSDLPRLFKECKLLGINFSDQQKHMLENMDMTTFLQKAGKTDEIENEEPWVNSLLQGYLLVKLQSLKTGMTLQQINDATKAVYPHGIGRYKEFFSDYFFGDDLRIIYRHKDLLKDVVKSENRKRDVSFFIRLHKNIPLYQQINSSFEPPYFSEVKDATRIMNAFKERVSQGDFSEGLLQHIFSFEVKPQELNALLRRLMITNEVCKLTNNPKALNSVLEASTYQDFYEKLTEKMIDVGVHQIYSDLEGDSLTQKQQQVAERVTKNQEFATTLEIACSSLGIYAQTTKDKDFESLKNAIRQAVELNLDPDINSYTKRRIENSAELFDLLFDGFDEPTRERVMTMWQNLSHNNIQNITSSDIDINEAIQTKINIITSTTRVDLQRDLGGLFQTKIASLSKQVADGKASPVEIEQLKIAQRFLMDGNGEIRKDLPKVYRELRVTIEDQFARLSDAATPAEEKQFIGKNLLFYRTLLNSVQSFYRLYNAEHAYSKKGIQVHEFDREVKVLMAALKRLRVVDGENLSKDIHLRIHESAVLDDLNNLLTITSLNDKEQYLHVETNTVVNFNQVAKAPEQNTTCQRLTEPTRYNDAAYARLLDGIDEMVNVAEYKGNRKENVSRSFIELSKVKLQQESNERLVVLMETTYTRPEMNDFDIRFRNEIINHILGRLEEAPEVSLMLSGYGLDTDNELIDSLAKKGYRLRSVSGNYFVNKSKSPVRRYYDSIGSQRVDEPQYRSFSGYCIVEKMNVA